MLAELVANRPVERRSDASATAILGVKVAAAEPAPPAEKKMRVVA